MLGARKSFSDVTRAIDSRSLPMNGLPMCCIEERISPGLGTNKFEIVKMLEPIVVPAFLYMYTIGIV